MAALLAFLLGMSAAAVWYVNRAPRPKVMPAASWEPIFFRVINRRTGTANLPALRAVSLPDEDLEVRVWVGSFGPYGEDGFILRRSSGRWSGIYLHGISERRPPEGNQEQKTPVTPKSGWEKLWQRLTGEGILTLPDAKAIGCQVGGLDSISYVVEANAGGVYRTYMYDNPQDAKCDEAKRVIEISETLYDEFGL
jgi:hypothetical protein